MQAGVPNVRQYPLSGPATHVKQVFNELGTFGHERRLLAYLDGQIWKSDDLDNFEPVIVPWLDQSPLRFFESAVRRVQYELQLPFAAFFDSLRFAQACRQELIEYDLFYERMGWMGYGGGLAAHWLGIPLVLEVNGDHLTEMEMLGRSPKGFQRWLSIALMKFATRKASLVVATGDGWRKIFIQRWGVEPSRVVVIENGSEMVDTLCRDQLRSFLPQMDASDQITVVYVGAFEPWHGIEELVRAFQKVMTQEKSVQLVLIGTGTELNEIKQLVSRLKIQDSVNLYGYLGKDKLAAELAKADIGVSPYCGRVEFSGLKLLDYKAAGLATIASGEDGKPAVIDHGRTGFIVPPCDEKALYEAMILLIRDDNLRQRMGREARLEAEKCHSWQHTAIELQRVFNRVIGKQTLSKGTARHYD
jgi:glycosyltransferase involved in cell wall biosynthesis